MPNIQQRNCPPGATRYVIQPGDTVFSLAQKFDVTVAAIVNVNRFVNLEVLRVGQEICMPPEASLPPCSGGVIYTIQPRDTLYNIAQRFNVTLADLREANPSLDPRQLRVGNVICLPVAVSPTVCPPRTRRYSVRRGDTFFSLARRFNTTVARLRELNPDVNPERLSIGQLICVPVN